ncbi:MAG TPA: hypothetical protein VJB09_02235 [Candidatus Paceibacterota bacterium]
MPGNFKALRVSIENQNQKTNLNRKIDQNKNWVVYDSSLDDVLDTYSFASDFNALIPEGFNGLRGYLIEKLKHKNGKAVGIEIAGPGSTLFHDLSKNHLFGRSAGFVLSDARITQRKAEDDTINHQVVEVSDAFSSKGYRKIEAWLGEEKADFIIERMVANMNSFPTDPEYLYGQLNRLYKLLAPGGVMFVMAPPIDKEDTGQNTIHNWIEDIKTKHKQVIDFDSYLNDGLNGDFTGNMGYYCIRLEKLANAPTELPK